MIFLAGAHPVIGLMVLLMLSVLVGLLVHFAFTQQAKGSLKSQKYITDKDLLELINNQPDKLLTGKRLARITNLKLSEARSRLQYLTRLGVVSYHTDNWLQYHYYLREPVVEIDNPSLSEKPFLTVEDILLLFKAHDFQLTYQKVCISTGLPIAVVKKEFDYFMKEKVIQKIYAAAGYGKSKTQIFLLREPYRSDTDKFLELERQMNLDLERIYKREMRH